MARIDLWFFEVRSISVCQADTRLVSLMWVARFSASLWPLCLRVGSPLAKSIKFLWLSDGLFLEASSRVVKEKSIYKKTYIILSKFNLKVKSS